MNTIEQLIADVATIVERTKSIQSTLEDLTERVAALEVIKVKFTAIGAAVGGIVSTFGPVVIDVVRKALT